MLDTDLAWAAGFLDGEGGFGIYKHGNTYTPNLVAANTKLAPLEKLKGLFGGNIGRLTPQSERSKLCFYWGVAASGQVLSVCKLLLPYLVVKANQAELLIAFGETTISNGVGYSDETLSFRDAIRQQITALNKKGP